MAVDSAFAFWLSGTGPVLFTACWGAESTPAEPKFHDRPLTHIWSPGGHRTDAAILRGLAHLRKVIPRWHHVVVLPDPDQADRLSHQDSDIIYFHEQALLDEGHWCPSPIIANHPRYYAGILNANAAPYKRHELAADVDNLLVIAPDHFYGRYASRGPEIRAALKKAVFAVEPGGTTFLSPKTVRDYCRQSRVGLMLSSAEGACRAWGEYLLCGLPIVATGAVGGRESMMLAEHLRIVAPDAKSVAAAVREMAGAEIDPWAVRNAFMRNVRDHRARLEAKIKQPIDWLRMPLQWTWAPMAELPDPPEPQPVPRIVGCAACSAPLAGEIGEKVFCTNCQNPASSRGSAPRFLGDGLLSPRVGLLAPGWAEGGVEMWFNSLAAQARKIEWSGVYVTDNGPFLESAAEETRKHCPVFRSSTDFQAFLRRCDTLLVWGNPNLSALLAGWGGKVISVSHGTSRWTEERLREYDPIVTARAAVSYAARNAYPAASRDSVRVIMNGVDPARLAPRKTQAQVCAEWGLPETSLPVVGYCGRFAPEKNAEAAARGVAELGYGYAVYQVTESTREAAKAAIAPLCEDIVWATGEVRDFYAGIDCLVVASFSEGNCLTILEAMLCGVPVIATPVGAVPEMRALAAYNDVVMLVPERPTPADLADAIGRADAPEGWEKAIRARGIAWTHFTSRRMAQQWEEFLMEVWRA